MLTTREGWKHHMGLHEKGIDIIRVREREGEGGMGRGRGEGGSVRGVPGC